MPYVTCAFCGHGGIQALNVGVCMNCLKFGGDRPKIYAIKQLLKEHKQGLTALEISKTLGISISDINRYRNEGILYETNNSEKMMDNSEENKHDKEDKIRTFREMYGERTNISNPMSANARTNYSKSKLVEDLKNLKNKRNQGLGRDD